MESWVKICPKCQSKEVTVRGISGVGYQQEYVCQSCGFQGPLFAEVKREDAKKLPNKPRQDIVPSRMPILAASRDEILKGKSTLGKILWFVLFILIFLVLL